MSIASELTDLKSKSAQAPNVHTDRRCTDKKKKPDTEGALGAAAPIC